MPEDQESGVDEVPERFEPDSPNPSLMEAEHWSRYQLAAQLCPGVRVLDAGCGTGYGTALLEGAGASEVVGVDVSEEALDAARRRVSQSRLVQADVAETGLEASSFDLIVCFEVVEHLTHQEAIVEEFARLLAPGGVLLISSPNRDVYPAGNPHHVRELTPEELEAMLQRRFKNVSILRQHSWLASAILSTAAHEDSNPREFLTSRVGKINGRTAGSETYSVAVASDSELPTLTVVAALAAADQIEEYSAAIKAMEYRLRDAEAAVQAASDRRLAADREAETAIKRRECSEAELEATKNHLRRANEALESITASLSWRLTAPLRKLRNRS